MSGLLITLIKSVTVTIICNKSLKALGKIDYADIIKFCGFGICSITIIQMIKLIIKSISESSLAEVVKVFIK